MDVVCVWVRGCDQLIREVFVLAQAVPSAFMRHRQGIEPNLSPGDNRSLYLSPLAPGETTDDRYDCTFGIAIFTGVAG
jgi:hypothetical protein